MCMTFFVCFNGDSDHRVRIVLTHSFPTRRSCVHRAEGRTLIPRTSCVPPSERKLLSCASIVTSWVKIPESFTSSASATSLYNKVRDPFAPNVSIRRSEEHTSELQSLMRTSYAGFCLNKKTYTHHILIITTH